MRATFFSQVVFLRLAQMEDNRLPSIPTLASLICIIGTESEVSTYRWRTPPPQNPSGSGLVGWHRPGTSRQWQGLPALECRVWIRTRAWSCSPGWRWEPNLEDEEDEEQHTLRTDRTSRPQQRLDRQKRCIFVSSNDSVCVFKEFQGKFERF